MILYLPSCFITDDEKKYSIDIKGNFESVYRQSFNDCFSEFRETSDFFLTPLPIQFRKGDDVFIWVDWNESQPADYTTLREQFQLTIEDRIFQAANEICRHTNDYLIRIISEKTVAPGWTEKIKERLERGFTVTVQMLE